MPRRGSSLRREGPCSEGEESMRPTQTVHAAQSAHADSCHRPQPKRIVLCADGTGNAFTHQESNVWRIYSALDLSSNAQIAHYIRGVGTSGFRPWALADGATGFGVPSNIRALYEFLCW